MAMDGRTSMTSVSDVISQIGALGTALQEAIESFVVQAVEQLRLELQAESAARIRLEAKVQELEVQCIEDLRHKLQNEYDARISLRDAVEDLQGKSQ